MVELYAQAFFMFFEYGFKIVMFDTQDDVTEHLDKTAIAVQGEALVARLGGQALDGIVVQPQVQDGIHHAGHGNRCPGTDGDQERVFGVAELFTIDGFQVL